MTIAPRPKRRSRPSPIARLRRFWLLGIFVLVIVAWGGFALASAPAFRLHELSVTGLTNVSRDDVVARAAIDPHANVWFLDRDAIERRIEGLPYVLQAHVHRRPIANVWLDIAERSADGCLRPRGGEAVTIDRADRVLDRGCTASVALAYELRARSDVPPGDYVRDPELASLQNDARILAATGDRFRTLRHDAFGGFEADLVDGIRIRFGDDRDLERKRKLIAPILAQLGARGERVRALDLRAPSTPVVELRPPTPAPAQIPARPQYTQGTQRVHHNM